MHQLARQQRPRPASAPHATARPADATGPLAQLAADLNAGSRVRALEALMRGMATPTVSGPVAQRKFTVPGSGGAKDEVFETAGTVMANTGFAALVKDDADKNDVINELDAMAADGADLGSRDRAGWVAEARARIEARKPKSAYSLFSGYDALDKAKLKKPTTDEFNMLARRNSDDFSGLLETNFGFTTTDLRKDTMRMVGTADDSVYHVSGPGRFMRFKNSQLGDTVYDKFTPGLAAKTGLSEQELADLFLNNLFNKDAFDKKVKEKALSSTALTAIKQNTALWDNEIINRSSNNLISLTQVLNNVKEGKGGSLNDSLKSSTLFYPKGGQSLSRSHWKYDDVKKRKRIEKIVEKNKSNMDSVIESVGNHALKNGDSDFSKIGDDFHKLNEEYVKNLSKRVKIEHGKKT